MFNFEKIEGTGVLTFVGDLTAHRLSEVKAALMLAVENVDHLVLNLEKVRTIDLACFRVLRAAGEKATELGKGLTLLGGAGNPGRTTGQGYLSLKSA
jgi:anti-anti-sigma regulatory factor